MDDSDFQIARKDLIESLGKGLSVIEAFDNIDHDRPTCFICYTVKGFGLPIAGHKDNHAGLMTPTQMDAFRQTMNIRAGFEWEPFEGLGAERDDDLRLDGLDLRPNRAHAFIFPLEPELLNDFADRCEQGSRVLQICLSTRLEVERRQAHARFRRPLQHVATA